MMHTSWWELIESSASLFPCDSTYFIVQNYSSYLAKTTRERIDTGLVYFAAIFSFVFRSHVIQTM